jgi:hypothetical protein
MSTDLLEGRVAELEARASRLILAGDGRDQGGWGAWHNLLETRLMQERDYFLELMAETLARFQRQILEEAKAMLDQALATRVRGTFAHTASYVRGDMVALDGGSFIARRDKPGPCPGDGWQLMAKQGSRGIAGPEGKRGPPGNIIVGWIVDRSTFRITPRLSDNSLGPPLELRELFEPSEDNTAG